MTKKSKGGEALKTQKTFYSALIFVIIWPVLLAILVQNHWLDSWLMQQDSDTSNTVLNIILLLPPAVVILPMLYRMDDLFGASKGKDRKLASWQRAVLSILGTAALLGLLWYLFIIISFALGY
jgi:hypothetical protein